MRMGKPQGHFGRGIVTQVFYEITHAFKNDEYKFIMLTLISNNYLENRMLCEENASRQTIII